MLFLVLTLKCLMMKRIIICADGTWNKPEENLEKDFPTNVLKFSRAIKPVDSKGVAQTVFYDWGIGSYHNSIKGCLLYTSPSPRDRG